MAWRMPSCHSQKHPETSRNHWNSTLWQHDMQHAANYRAGGCGSFRPCTGSFQWHSQAQSNPCRRSVGWCGMIKLDIGMAVSLYHQSSSISCGWLRSIDGTWWYLLTYCLTARQGLPRDRCKCPFSWSWGNATYATDRRPKWRQRRATVTEGSTNLNVAREISTGTINIIWHEYHETLWK